MPKADKSVVKNNFLISGSSTIEVGSPVWFEWLSTAKTFSVRSSRGNFVARCEKRRNQAYWYAYRRAGKLMKMYLGKTEDLTAQRLEQASLSLTGQRLLRQLGEPSSENQNDIPEARIDSSFLPLTKVNVPALPRTLLSRRRLTRKINTPLTVIHAPSGFGKSTLLNDWRQNCGHPVAWLSLDEGDNDVYRFWYSVAMALQTVNPDFGKELLIYLGTASTIHAAEIISRFTNEIVQSQASHPHFSLVLDDLHRIHLTEIYDSIQTLIEHLPSNMQLILLGHSSPPLTVGHLRAKGRLTEMDANDLRFTVEEGIDYLSQYQQETQLAYSDLAKLVRHTEGWAAGLTLTALALGKQEDHRQFVDTFSGAHIYMREYFMETVLQRSSPEVHAFLLKTAILKQLHGSLCDVVTGQTGCEEILLRLWHENLFIVKLEEQGWYRYHDLFSEMLLSQLQTRFPHEVPELHKRAAQWYRTQHAPADAIYHLLAIEAWEEAALLMEEMALRELEQYGEDSRLLRWLQELPTSVVQKHKTLLFVYLQLAQVALPRQKMERFIDHIETNLSGKTASQQSQDERDVLTEIQQIRHAWEHGAEFALPARHASENDAKWELLNSMHLLGQADSPDVKMLEDQITVLLNKAKVQRNLFVILMAGGALARLAFGSGQLRRSEKIARQVLEQALAQRGKLPEPASIVLAMLSQISMERNELTQAQQYLARAMQVDPNPTSTNMLVQIAVQRAEIQMALSSFDEALINIQAIRELHLQRPSGVWTDQDLLAYEAFINIRSGDVLSAEQRLNQVEILEGHGISQLVTAEISLAKSQPDVAEEILGGLMSQHPNGFSLIPCMRMRVLQARALFDQHKMNRALQVMKEAVRLAAPEQFIRPFLEGSVTCLPLLALTLQTEHLTKESHDFIRNILRLSGYAGSDLQISRMEIESLSTSASISPREQEVLRLMGTGLSNRDLAKRLSISESTVKTHVANIYYKLNVNSRIQAITYAKELKLM